MPRIMTTNATVFCPHGGAGMSIPTMPIWDIEGGIALREGDTGTLTCSFPVPCAGYVLRSMKLNATTIGGANAILETDFNQTFTGLPLAITEHHHAIDNSTPAPIPNGGQAAALSARTAGRRARRSSSRYPRLLPSSSRPPSRASRSHSR